MTYAIYILVKWTLGFLMFWRLPKPNSEMLGSVRRQRVSVIIPARNEAENLPDLLASLDANSFPPLEVIVVDDSSEDDTSYVAEEAGVKVISAGRLPEGWMGKPYACWIGALKAEGEFLLFLDADTRLLPETLSALLAQYLEQGSGIVSVYPYHIMEKGYEHLRCFFNLISTMSMGMSTIFGQRLKPLGAHGACILCSHEEYFRFGGHSAVRGKIIEDIAIGQLFRDNNMPVRCFGGKGLLSFRMYPQGMGQLVEGWSKNFAAGAKSMHLAMLLPVTAWIYGAFQVVHAVALSSISGNFESLSWALFAYSAYGAQIFWILRRIGNFSRLTALFFPIPLIFFGLIFFRSVILTFVIRQVRWRGRYISIHQKN